MVPRPLRFVVTCEHASAAVPRGLRGFALGVALADVAAAGAPEGR
jgi:hypothetical protein